MRAYAAFVWRRREEYGAVLKLGMPHMAGEHEIQGLRFRDGDPTVQRSTPLEVWDAVALK